MAGCGTSTAQDPEGLEGRSSALEASSSWEGTLRATIVDPPEGEGPSRVEEYLELTDGMYVPLERAAGAGALQSGQRARVFGRLAGERIQATHFERMSLRRGAANSDEPLAMAGSDEPLDGEDSDELLEAVTPRPTGPSKKLAVILVSLPGATNTFNPDQVRTAVFGATGRSSRTFWEEGSFGKLTITGHLSADGDVFGPYAISGDCSFSNVVNASAQAAMAAGVDLSPYAHVIRYTPAGASGCAGGGQGDQPGRNAIVFGVGVNALWDYVGHEVGHNFGCGHASSYDNCQGRFAGSCQHNEYGDPTDIMGRRNGHYMSYYKNAMGWLEPSNHAVVTASRQVRLYPIEVPTSGLISVLVPRGDNTQFHLEFRRPLGTDSFLETGLTNGVLVRYLPSGNGLPHLINFATQTSAVDAALKPGTSFTDANREIRVVEVSNESALVNIIIDGVAPTPVGGASGTGGASGMTGGTSGMTGGTGGKATGGTGMTGGTGGKATGGTGMTGGTGGKATGGTGGVTGPSAGAAGRAAGGGTGGTTAGSGGAAGSSAAGTGPGGSNTGGMAGGAGGGNLGAGGSTSGSSSGGQPGAAGGSGATSASTGGSAGALGSAGSTNAGAPFAGGPGASTGGSGTSPVPVPVEDAGCACRVPGVGTQGSPHGRSSSVLLALALGLALRRRALRKTA